MIPNRLIANLANAADAALSPILQTGASSHGQAPPTGEVGFVAAAVLGGVPAIASAWNPILGPAGYHVRMSGVFCHKAPQATFTDSAGNSVSCELADLLVVVDDLTSGGSGQRWAALIQAKMAAAGGGKTLTGTLDLRQLDLFTRWPLFSLPTGYRQGNRDFATCGHSGAPIDCGRYGLIDGQPSPKWHQQAPSTVMSAGGDQLGSFLAHMVEVGQSGFGREATGTTDDWSMTVDELLNLTYASVFNYVTGFGPSNPQPRQTSALSLVATTPRAFRVSDRPIFYYVRDNVWWEDRPPPSGGKPEFPDDGLPEMRGLSVLRIGIGGDGIER
ncbi:hypothetical protein [Bosea vaviloviae]|uniref:hypothetical protein n=1 Tax=Bosea vaviloviae TaxID=1526658 RepID=UPI000A628891|nr:hypothetical protein [Bosea vaviloviae]